jgi:Arabinose-binding domain of AraC transcription regulator, N-term
MAMTNGRAAPQRTLPPGYIHLGVAKEIAPTLRDLGIDPDPVIREAGLDPRLFDDGTNVIPHGALGRLLTLCVARAHCPHFGFLRRYRVLGRHPALAAHAADKQPLFGGRHCPFAGGTAAP